MELADLEVDSENLKKVLHVSILQANEMGQPDSDKQVSDLNFIRNQGSHEHNVRMQNEDRDCQAQNNQGSYEHTNHVEETMGACAWSSQDKSTHLLFLTESEVTK